MPDATLTPTSTRAVHQGRTHLTLNRGDNAGVELTPAEAGELRDHLT